ncbi:hypothetical protein AMJ86_01860 [bacterium SM23_57]|nr:MAG: hypothetical protein AMJ86_01860 [bacterium SM23_57]
MKFDSWYSTMLLEIRMILLPLRFEKPEKPRQFSEVISCLADKFSPHKMEIFPNVMWYLRYWIEVDIWTNWNWTLDTRRIFR